MNSNFNAAIFHKGKKLTGDEMMDTADKCPVCLSRDNRPKVLPLQNDPDVSLLNCKVCEAVSASRMPTSAALDSYYGSYYSDNNSKVTFHSMDRFAAHIYKLISRKKKLNGALRILDYGGGDGSLGLALAESWRNKSDIMEVVLVDYNVEESFSRDGIQFYSFRNLKEISGQFDIILASAVLEHIPELHSVIEELYSHLKPDGFFYARTPYMVPFKKLIKGLDFTFPGHVHDLGPKFWNTFSIPLKLNWKLMVSRSSIVETEFGNAFLRTLISYLCKFPSRLEEKFAGNLLTNPKWKFVGGWEVLFRNSNNK